MTEYFTSFIAQLFGFHCCQTYRRKYQQKYEHVIWLMWSLIFVKTRCFEQNYWDNPLSFHISSYTWCYNKSECTQNFQFLLPNTKIMFSEVFEITLHSTVICQPLSFLTYQVIVSIMACGVILKLSTLLCKTYVMFET